MGHTATSPRRETVGPSAPVSGRGEVSLRKAIDTAIELLEEECAELSYDANVFDIEGHDFIFARRASEKRAFYAACIERLRPFTKIRE